MAGRSIKSGRAITTRRAMRADAGTIGRIYNPGI
jgi:hypothetical protein